MESDIRETISFYYSSYIKDAVAPSRVRGLKHKVTLTIFLEIDRRTLTGAWIEAYCLGSYPIRAGVAPSRVRGLKRLLHGCRSDVGTSHPHGCVD